MDPNVLGAFLAACAGHDGFRCVMDAPADGLGVKMEAATAMRESMTLTSLNSMKGAAMSKTAELRFQYLRTGADRPESGYTITDVCLPIGPGTPIPRVGEIVLHMPFGQDDSANLRSLIVLSVHHDIQRNHQDHTQLWGWTVTVTLGDIPDDMDPRLLDIRD